MQRKKFVRNERGSIAVIVTATLFSFYIILLGLYARASFVRRSQLMADIALKSHYEVEVVGLLERAQNAGFAWKLGNAEYLNKVAKVTFYVEDKDHNIDIDLFSKNLFNGHYNVGYIDPADGVVTNDPQYGNSIYTDFIHIGSPSVYRCFGQNAGDEVVTWLSYRADGTYMKEDLITGDTYTKPSGAAYFRVMWKKGITKTESENILIYSSYPGDTSTPTYEAPSNGIHVLINGIDINDKANLTTYETTASNSKRREIVVEVRNVPTDGPLKIVIPEKTISRVVDGNKEYNFRNTWYPRIIVTK